MPEYRDFTIYETGRLFNDPNYVAPPAEPSLASRTGSSN